VYDSATNRQLGTCKRCALRRIDRWRRVEADLRTNSLGKSQCRFVDCWLHISYFAIKIPDGHNARAAASPVSVKGVYQPK
jgi:hypothetical protein